MSILDFLNPGNDVLSPVASTDAQLAPQPQAAHPEPAMSPAAIIQMAAAMKEQKDLVSKKEGRLPAMYDAEGRKLGAAGVLLALQRDLRLARSEGNSEEIERIQGLMPDVENAVEAFIKKSGLSRAELFPSATKKANVYQGAAIQRIGALRKKHAALLKQIKQGGRPGPVHMLRLHAQAAMSEAALIALQAGLIEPHELSLAARLGFWALMPPVVSQEPRPQPESNQGDQQRAAAAVIEIQNEGDRA